MLKASCSPVLTDLIKTTNAVITGIRVYTYGQPVKLQEFKQVSYSTNIAIRWVSLFLSSYH